MKGGGSPRVAIVGIRRARTGLGRYFARHLVRCGAKVPAFIGTRPSTVAEARELLAADGIQASGFTTLDELIRAEPVDALVIASPHETHAEWLQRALDAGLQVLCEKPLVWGVPDPADRAADLVAEFHARDLLLMEHCQWPLTLPAYDMLHPDARETGIRDFEMWLSPSAPGTAMLLDTLSHPLSLLQALTDSDGSTIATPRFSTRDPDASELDLSFVYRGGRSRVRVRIHLRVVPTQPRPAGFAIDGRRAERLIEMPAYRFSLADGSRTVPLPDPTEAFVRRFVSALRGGMPETEASRERLWITERMWMLEQLVRAFDRG
jgi:predicted dehydrogenase